MYDYVMLMFPSTELAFEYWFDCKILSVLADEFRPECMDFLAKDLFKLVDFHDVILFLFSSFLFDFN